MSEMKYSLTFWYTFWITFKIPMVLKPRNSVNWVCTLPKWRDNIRSFHQPKKKNRWEKESIRSKIVIWMSFEDYILSIFIKYHPVCLFIINSRLYGHNHTSIWPITLPSSPSNIPLPFCSNNTWPQLSPPISEQPSSLVPEIFSCLMLFVQISVCDISGSYFPPYSIDCSNGQPGPPALFHLLLLKNCPQGKFRDKTVHPSRQPSDPDFQCRM